MTRTKVIIINGEPRCGKDTFVHLASEYCDMNEMANVLNISSVDPIKDILISFGWDGEKTDAIRNLISDIKKLWTLAQNGPTMYLMNNIIQFHTSHPNEDNIVFCHIREPEEIKKLVDAISGMSTMGIDIQTMYIIRKDNNSNSTCLSDNPLVIRDYIYDVYVYNNSDLATYDSKVCEFIDKILN